MQNILNYFNNFKINILPEKGPWTAILLIPVIIISGAYWNSIPFYIVLATIWISQRNSDIPLNWTIVLIVSIGFSLFATQMEDVISFADKKLTMPPKSTWFDPKPLDGLVAYDFE